LTPIFLTHALFLSFTFAANPLSAQKAEDQTIQKIVVRGQAKVEADAILTLLDSKAGAKLNPETIKGDIKSLYELGYFSDIRFYKTQTAEGIELVVEVVEKPAIISIEFKGQEELSEDDFKEKLETKLYTIVNEATITSDVRMIQKQYSDKGYFLSSVTYNLEKKGANEVAITFQIAEGGKVQVGEVYILGNEYFTDNDIMNGAPGLASRPYTRSSAFSDSSIYQDDLVKRDLEYISYIYRDQGFAEVKVAKPSQVLDSDREFVRLTFQVEEGLQYDVGSIDVSGDLLFEKAELLEEMLLKPSELFRYSRFTRDIEMLVDKYGDLGYAYADVNPKTTFDREKKIVHINYEIKKGEKVYFGDMTILGNTKTRDNVIRREFEIADSELYSGTRLTKTKNNINRLGFFEEVQVLKERDEKQQNLLNLKIKVKEKPTGQLQAAIGFTPNSSGTRGSQFFGQGRYDEKNQSGKGWQTNLQGRWNGEQNYEISAGFSDPRVNDSIWSTGTDVFYKNEKREHIAGIEVEEKRIGGSVFLGRKIIELLRGRLTYRIQKVSRDAGDAFLLDRFREDGVLSSAIISLLRKDVDNYIDPTEGSELAISQNFTGGPVLMGDHQFMESSFDGTYYFPIDFTEGYRTYFKFHGVFSYIYPLGDQPVPFTERYRLGGYSDLRGFKYWSIGPKFYMVNSPSGSKSVVNKGGDKKVVFQLEYFMPLIPEAGIKALIFGDMGRIYDDDEAVQLYGFKRDVGFGFRWITPIAPFRFEWAYPIEENGKLGNMEIIFYIGF
jgi:outer membrane protein insertion porin family